MTYLCDGCGQPLADGGPVGLFCVNKDCDHEVKLVESIYKQYKEQKERKELARLKAKYEGKP